MGLGQNRSLLALTIDFQDRVWGWGQDIHYQLGGTGHTMVPRLLFTKSTKKVVATEYTSYFLTIEGVLYFLGGDVGFRLPYPSVDVPTILDTSPRKIIDFTATSEGVAAVDIKGDVWFYGTTRNLRYQNPPLRCGFPVPVAKVILTERWLARISIQGELDRRGWPIEQRFVPLGSPFTDFASNNECSVALYQGGLWQISGVEHREGSDAHSIVATAKIVAVLNAEGKLLYYKGPDLKGAPLMSQIDGVIHVELIEK